MPRRWRYRVARGVCASLLLASVLTAVRLEQTPSAPGLLHQHLLGDGTADSQAQPIAGQAMRFSVNPQYDMKGLPGTSRFKVLVTIQLLVPDKG